MIYCEILASVDESGTGHGLLLVAASNHHQATDFSRLLEPCREPESMLWICNIYHPHGIVRQPFAVAEWF